MIYQGVLVVSLLFLGCALSDNHFCSFDNGTCGYTNGRAFNGRGVWSAQINFNGIKDHTGNGSYMRAKYQFVWLSRRLNVAQLISPSFQDIGCVQFYYYREVSSGGSLDVIAKRGNNLTLLWSVENGNTGGWKLASIPVTVRGADSIQLVFQSDVFTSNNKLTAIDDVSVKQTSSCTLQPAQPKDRIFPEVQGSCHFDTSLCGYTNVNGSKVWRRNRHRTLTYGTGPDYDHTFKNGGYMFAESSGIKTGTKSQLISPILKNVQCASFYYHMYGTQSGTFNVYKRVKNTDYRVFSTYGNKGRQWLKGVVYLHQHAANASFRLVFESVRLGYKGDIAIDDVLTYSCPHPPTNAPTTPSTFMPTSSSIPPTITGSVPAQTTMFGQATTPTPTAGIQRIRLVNGPTKYEGRVEVLYNGQWGTICDDSWDDQEAKVVCKMLGFKGYVRPVKSAAYGRGSGTIWLDDIDCVGTEKSLFDCRHAQWGINNCGHGEDAGVVCQADSPLTPMNGTCTFDVNRCGYMSADRSVSEFDWTRRSGGTPSSYTGPTSGVGGKGYYMYIEVSSGVTGARAKLISPMLPPSTKCISFYYHMRGSDIGSLNVYIQSSTFNSSVMKIWSLSQQQGSRWLQGKMPLQDAGDQPFQVIFEGVRGNDYKGDVSIDSIVTLTTTCNFVPANAKYKPDPNAKEGMVRLAGGADANSGRVEIYHRGQWGTICRNRWNNKNTNVVCKMLGFVTGRTLISSSSAGSGPIWLDGVQCNGNEQSLAQCRKKTWGYHSCSHSQDVSITCVNGRHFKGEMVGMILKSL